ncbi:MAG: M20/M25/M40 family metallo-hydrolase [Candidatus Rokubacteria bacterium]|nr:M20/M25/M40 family metallo-hydrolase [Candidatus Rokubacteria bacterium]
MRILYNTTVRPGAVPRSLAVLITLAVALVQAAASQSGSPQAPPAAWLLDQVKVLSAPEMEGRSSGTPGADRAARHIGRVFQETGLRPGGEAGGFLQAFQVPTGIRLGSANALSILAPSLRSLALGREFTPLAVSTDGSAVGELVFVGYGITAPDLHYDDYANLDVRDKIVLAITREPRSQDPGSPFRRPEAYHYSQRNHKIINAREHGALGIILVAHPAADTEALPALRGVSQPWGIVAAFLTRAVGEDLLAPSGKRLAELADGIDRTLTPQSFLVTNTRLRLEVNLVRERGTTANVVGILPGTDPRLKDEAIVIGAHYDHLGRGGEGSLAPDQAGTIHPGADDNASGTAAVMALARTFAAAGGLSRTLVFVAFAGEEMGLLGSSHYVKRPAFPLERTILMVNLDMIGRLRDGKLYAAGVDSGTGLRALVTDAAQGLGLSLQLRGDPYSPSDHTAFYTAERPVLFLFTGAHGDYHRPTDTWEKLNPQGLETVTTFAARVVAAAASAATPPAYVKVQAPPSRARGGGYGPFFGIVPDFGEAERPGVRISGVRPGSPAAKAGVQAGDVIVKFAGVMVKTLDDLTFALRGRRPGDRVDVVIFRDGQERQVEATLEERR